MNVEASSSSSLQFDHKQAARVYVWKTLRDRNAARFPFPVQGRIPNFAGARDAAARLFTIPEFRDARVLKINPDSPQRWVRAEALRRGIICYVPTPRLRAGFRCLDPGEIPESRYQQAATLSGVEQWGRLVPLAELPAMDAIVTGSVAVTTDGARCGKGEGYGDLEYGILRALGQKDAPVATTVHPLQIVGSFPTSATDLPLHYVVTDETIHETQCSGADHPGVLWEALDEERLVEMPVLQELRDGSHPPSGSDTSSP
jgi:5-formyltetrahydrofolate cyclo-ligase